MTVKSVAIVLCGGHGKRLWPLSTPAKPKPFLTLMGPETLFQQALRRASATPFTLTPIVVAQACHADLVHQQAEEIGLPVDLLLEDRGNDTGLAVVLGALAAQKRHGAVTVAILASDHHIPDAAGFSDLMQQANVQSKNKGLIMFGVPPTSPSSAFGYIVPLHLEDGESARRVARFIEKPHTEQATSLITEGALWNSGNFVMAVDALLSAAQRHAPALLQAAEDALNAAHRQGASTTVSVSLDKKHARSFDYAIVEKLEEVWVMPMTMAWSDIGTWDEVHRLRAIAGQLVLGDHIPIKVIGLDDVIVVATPEGILVTRLGHTEALKSSAEES